MSLRTLRFHALQRRVGVFGTDDLLAAVLQAQGIQLTRRTVAKYREDINIPSTDQRRKRNWKTGTKVHPLHYRARLIPFVGHHLLDAGDHSSSCHFSAEVLRGFRIGSSDTIYAALSTGA